MAIEEVDKGHLFPGIWRSQFKTENDQGCAYRIIYNPVPYADPLLAFSAPFLRPGRRSLDEVCLAGDFPIFRASRATS
jgi:hypothetical protein